MCRWYINKSIIYDCRLALVLQKQASEYVEAVLVTPHEGVLALQKQ